jgi:hypothetical protein
LALLPTRERVVPAWHLRPRSAPEIIDASIQLLRQHARPLLLLAVVSMIPGAVFGLLNALVAGSDLTALSASPKSVPTMQPAAALLLVPAALLGGCWFMIAFGAIVGAASTAYVDGAPIDPAEALRRVRARAGVVLGSGVLTYLLVLVQVAGLMVAFFVIGGIVAAVIGVVASAGRSAGTAGTALLGVVALALGFAAVAVALCAGAWLVGRYAALPAVAVNESLGVRDSMRRARELSRGSVARVTGLLLLVGLLFLVVSIGGFVVLAAVLRNAAAASVLLSLVHVPLYAFGASLVAVLYYDLRVRHEGLDIELLAQELSTEPTLAAHSGR